MRQFFWIWAALLTSVILSGLVYAEPDEVKVKWRVKTEGAIRANSVIDGDSLFVASTDGKLYAIDKNTGEIAWRFKSRGSIASAPAVEGNLVVVTNRDHKVFALNRNTGKVLWKYSMKPADEVPHSGWRYSAGAPVITNRKVYVSSERGTIYALDRHSGKVCWTYRTGGQIRATPLVTDSALYQPSNDGYVYVINPSNGKLFWRFATQGVELKSEEWSFDRKSIFTKPLLKDDTLIVGSRDGNVYAIDVNTHKAKWTFSYGTTWAMSTALDEDTVYVGWSTNNLVSAIDFSTGQERWQYSAGAHNYTTPLVTGSSVYFGSADGHFYRLDKFSGERIWSYAIGQEIYSSPIYDEVTDSLYLGSDDGNIYALAQSELVHKAVYHPENIQDISQWVVMDAGITPYLEEKGFTRLNSPESLSTFVSERLADGVPSVIVFNLPIVPVDLMGDDPAQGLLRAYLNDGGKVVWLGSPPNYYEVKPTGDGFTRDSTSGSKLLDVDFIAETESGNYFVKATQQGKNWGLPRWMKSSGSPVLAKQVTPLAVDEFGRVSVWLKEYHSRAGSGFLSIRSWAWSVPIQTRDLELIHRLAVYGLE